MKFSLVLRDKKNNIHLTTKTPEAFIERIQYDTKDQAVTNRRRYVAEFGESDTYDRQMPTHVIYPAAELEKDANGNLRMRQFNAIVVLTVADLLRPADVEAVKKAAQILPFTFAAFAGPTGKETVILVKIDAHQTEQQLTENEADTLCKKAYQLAAALYGSILPGQIRTEEASVRTCFRMTLDVTPYLNLQAMGLQVSETVPPAMKMSSEAGASTDFDLYTEYERLYRRASELAYNETADVIEGQRKQAYITELARQLCVMGVPEEEAATHIRNHHVFKKEYNHLEMRMIVEAVYAENKPERHTDSDLAIGRETQQLISFLNTRYVFRYNTIMGYTEYRPNHSYVAEWQVADDRAVKGMTMEVRLAGLDARDHDVRRYVQSNMIRLYNPVEEYLWDVQNEWDGKTDHIRRLARTVPTKNPYWEDWFYTWFLGMVQQWKAGANAQYGNQSVPLLISAQGWNKTTFCESLIPPELRWGYTANLQMNDKKQVLQQMAQMLLINMDEFNQISPQMQQGFLKNIISLPSVKIKRPYGRHVELMPRMASFIATTNQADVLADPSGNRRFLGVELSAPIDVSTPPNYRQLYGQAMCALRKHEPHFFGPEQTQQIMKANRQFGIRSAAEQFFLDYFEPARNETEGTWMTTSAIFEFLKKKVGISILKPSTVSGLGRKLANMEGLRRRETRNNSEYLVVLKQK